MGVNFSPFEIGRLALRASQVGLNVAGQNIANVNTPGYTRQAVQLSAAPPNGSSLGLVGAGVTIDGVRSFRERFVESRLQTETAIAGRLTAQRDALAPVDAAFNETDRGGIRSALTGFFNAFSDLEAHPTSIPLRAAVTTKGIELSEAFRSTRSRLSDIRREADGAMRSTVDEVNTLAREVAALNGRISFADGVGTNNSELRDRRGEVVRQLAELTGARSVENNDGSVTLTLGDGRPLVMGEHVSPIEIVETPPDGLAALILDGAPAVISDGRVRGLLDAIGDIGGQITSLDELAASVSARVNNLHASGSDLNGNDGIAFFAPPAGGAPVTADNLSVSAALIADPRLVVAAARGANSGDAAIARAINGLLTDTTSQAGARTGSYSSIYGSIVAEAGAGVRAAEDALTTQQAILAQATAQRDSFSGVSLDEEAIHLLQYQKAYEAAARFLKIADEMTQTILSLAQ